MKTRTLNSIHDYRSSQSNKRQDGDVFALRILCSACTPNHEGVEVVDDQVEDDECDKCGMPGLCESSGELRAIKWCGCEACGA